MYNLQNVLLGLEIMLLFSKIVSDVAERRAARRLRHLARGSR
jgi:hypothetical protein